MSTSDLHQPTPSPKQLWVTSLQLQYLRQQLTYVDYRQAEADCEALAAQLLDVYSEEELRDFTFAAIPRGGLIVLGMLSYWLDLSPAQMTADITGVRGPLCVVDDCSLTGLRLKEILTHSISPHVAFIHLYSHPDLRAGILEREPRVRCCLAARDLAELPGVDVATSADVEARAWEPLPLTRAYWSRATAPIAFAWSEPLIHIREPFSGRIENGWRFMPPHRCIKNRVDLGIPLLPALPRHWQAPEELVTCQCNDLLWLVLTRTGTIHQLEDFAADAWRGLATYGNVETTLDFLATRSPLQRSDLQAKLADIMQIFLDAEVLEPV